MAQILDALRRDGDSSNSIIGIVILVLLTVFVAPDVLPQLVAETIPFVDEGLPCNLLQNAQDRANHQSLIGRASSDPLLLRAEIGTFPTDGTSPLVIRVIIINNTIGTVPIIYNPNQVIIGDDPNSSGVGVIFNPPISATLDFDRNGVPNARVPGQATFNANDIKILGPRQRCVHRIEIQASQLGGIQPGQTSVQAYYRIQSAGSVQQVNPLATPIYTDQGLNRVTGGFVQSPAATIPFRAFSNEAN